MITDKQQYTYHVRIICSHNNHLKCIVSTIDIVTLDTISYIESDAARVLIIEESILIETAIPLVYIFVNDTAIARINSQAPIVNFTCITGTYAVDVLSNYYLFDSNITLLEASCVYPRDPYSIDTSDLVIMPMDLEQLCDINGVFSVQKI